jgi:predicted DNA-binding ribbon-helix-helix protein
MPDATPAPDVSADDLSAVLNQPVIKRSVRIAGHATSISLEKPFWELFKKMAKVKGKSVNELAADIDDARSINLSSAIRLYILHTIEKE